MTNTSARPLTQIEITYAAPRLDVRVVGLRASRAREVWEARSTDGTWLYTRTEETGTPWVVTHVPTGYAEYFSSLAKARMWTCSDAAVPQVRRGLLFELARARRIARDDHLLAKELENKIIEMLTRLTAMVMLTA
jgi:hypothetical protein